MTEELEMDAARVAITLRSGRVIDTVVDGDPNETYGAIVAHLGDTSNATFVITGAWGTVVRVAEIETIEVVPFSTSAEHDG